MANYIHWTKFDEEKLSVLEPEKGTKDLSDGKGKKGKKNEIEYTMLKSVYTYPDGIKAPFMWEEDEITTTGVVEKIDAKNGGKSYQMGTIGANVSPAKLKFYTSVRRRMIDEAVRMYGEELDIKDINFDGDPKRGGIRMMIWQDKKSKSATRIYFPIKSWTKFFIPSSKTKSKTQSIDKATILQTEDGEQRYNVKHRPLCKATDIYIGQNNSLRWEITETLIRTMEESTEISHQAETAARYLEEDPDFAENEAKNEAFLSAKKNKSKKSNDSDSDNESDDDTPKKKKDVSKFMKEESDDEGSGDESEKKSSKKSDKTGSDKKETKKSDRKSDDSESKKSGSGSEKKGKKGSAVDVMDEESDDETPKKSKKSDRGKSKAKKEESEDEENGGDDD